MEGRGADFKTSPNIQLSHILLTLPPTFFLPFAPLSSLSFTHTHEKKEKGNLLEEEMGREEEMMEEKEEGR